MDNVLSREETAALLQGIKDGSVETEAGARSSGVVRPYDFAERNTITRGDLPGLDRIHERYARELRVSLSTLLRRELDVVGFETRLAKLGDYVKTLHAPSSLNVVDVKPLAGRALVVLDPVFVYLAVDTFFGGPARMPGTIAPRPLTACETRIVELVRERVFAELKKAWQPVRQIDLALVASECDPQCLDWGTPGDALYVTRFQVRIGDSQGMLELAMPTAMIAPLREQLEGPTPGGQGVAREEWAAALGRQLRDAPVEVGATLVRMTLSLRDVVALRPGDVIPTDIAETITVVSGNAPLFRARFGASRGRNALRIIERINPAKASRNPT
jgi:flagellar motor switch protein FliM